MNKKLILGALMFGAVLSSCSNNGNKAETSEAEEVEVVKTEESVVYSTIGEGSHIEWRASHLGGVQKRYGKVFLQSAEVIVNGGEVTNAKMVHDMSTITIENFEAGSEDSLNLADHLKSADFFNIETYPTTTFELTGIEKNEGDFNSLVTGNLTILDETKSITFKANVEVSENEVSVKSEDFAVDRTDWGLSYHVEGSEGVPVDYLIANDIGFTIDITLTK
ncbi:MAG: YceI family protein [Putridiphycobacter sp.]